MANKPIIRDFSGRLNYDDAPNVLPPKDYADALNITRDAQGTGQDRIVSNIVGNTLVPYSLPAGTNKFIGGREDLVNNRAYLFIWNSNGNHLILYFDRASNTIIKLIESIVDTGGTDVLNFNPSWRINHIDIIYRAEGDLLFWTDGLNVPRKINVAHILANIYSTVKTQFIEVAKRPPLSAPLCVYGSDATRNSNSLRRKLFIIGQRWKCDDFEFTSYSTYSKIALPIGFYGSDNDIDSTKNNFITVTVQTGDENVTDIEIIMRYNISNAWSDFVLVVSLNKAQLGIPNNTSYNYLFYNDGIYPPVDQKEIINYFDWVPQKAYAQILANGNTLVYGAITENYDNYPTNLLDVTITAANVTNSPPDATPPQLTYVTTGTIWTFTVTGSVPIGTRYRIIATIGGAPTLFADYTSIGGDNIDDVAAGIRNYIVTHFPGYAGSITFNSFLVSPPVPGFTVTLILVDPGGSGGGTISTEKTWMWGANYIFGLVYEDEQGRAMPGVTTFVNPTNSDNDFAVTTPEFSQSSGTAQTPVISAAINHLPAAEAIKYSWVRRRLTYDNPLMYETCDYQDGTTTDPNDKSLYFCLANIEQYKLDNTQFNYGTAPVGTESRIKIICLITGGAYSSTVFGQDYQIIGTATRTLTAGTSPADDKLFIKVQRPAAVPAYGVNMMVMVYTPIANPTSLADSVFWEWGESYDIYNLGGVNYHRGKDQDQTTSQPATFTWPEGDVYFHERTMYRQIRVAPFTTTQDKLAIMDTGFSDFFPSSVNDNGRGQAIEVTAKKTYFPVLVRFGLEYQANTSINQTNRFYFDNLDDTYDRSFGDIRKMFIEGRYLYIFQKFDIGVVPVLTQIVKDTANDPLQANSDQLLNKITYPYVGRHGIGDCPESFAWSKYAKYFIDPNKGVVCRLSLDGITVLSVTYKTNSFFVAKLAAFRKDLNNGIVPAGQVYTGDPTVFGGFDSYTNKYIISLEQIDRYSNPVTLIFHQDPYTLSFLETRDESEGFESPLSFHPEGMVVIENLFLSFKNGQLWKHDSALFNTFYGASFSSFITGVFNDNAKIKKSFNRVAYQSNQVWVSPTNGDITTDSINIQTLLPQISQLKSVDYELSEAGYRYAALLRDANSGLDPQMALVEGDYLNGSYCIIKFVYNGTNFAYLFAPDLTWSLLPRNF